MEWLKNKSILILFFGYPACRCSLIIHTTCVLKLKYKYAIVYAIFLAIFMSMSVLSEYVSMHHMYSVSVETRK